MTGPPPKSSEALYAELAARRDAQPLTTLCGFCDWRHEGQAGDARVAARAHREANHPEAAKVKTRGRKRVWMTRKDQERDPRVLEAVRLEAAESNRARAEREDGDRLAKVLRGRARDRSAEEAA